MSSKISALPNMTALVGTELLTGLQGGVNSNATPAQVKAYVQPYKVYRALITQVGGGAPTALILENQLGGVIVFARSSQGMYNGTLVGAFPVGKTFMLFGPVYDTPSGAPAFVSANILSTDVFNFTTYSLNDPGILDSVLSNTALEILVYP